MFNQNKHNVKVVLLINDVIYISEVIVQTITQLNDHLSLAAVFKLGSADQRGSVVGSHGVRETIPKSSNCLHGF